MIGRQTTQAASVPAVWVVWLHAGTHSSVPSSKSMTNFDIGVLRIICSLRCAASLQQLPIAKEGCDRVQETGQRQR